MSSLSAALKMRKMGKGKKYPTVEQADNVTDGNPKDWFGKGAKRNRIKVVDPHRSLKKALLGIDSNI